MLHGELFNQILNADKISTHAHHYPKDFFTDMSLEKMLSEAYVSWAGIEIGDTKEQHKNYLDKVRYKSYFVYLSRALQKIYDMSEPLNEDNWEEYDARIASKYKNEDVQTHILNDLCKYKTSFLDAYWKPGFDNENRELFTPVTRIDPYLLAYDKDSLDHDGNNMYTLKGEFFTSLDDYIDFFGDMIRKDIADGCVAIKCAMAYDRGMKFTNFDKGKAEKIFTDPNFTEQDIENFQDYVVDFTCKLACELDVPFQWHTGMAKLIDTNAICLMNLIERHPNTKFVIFHGSYPWCGDVPALLHNYSNVYADLVWLPILSPTAAVRTLHEMIEIGTADKLCWGCDAKIPEESYGTTIALADILSTVLDEKLKSGYIAEKDCKIIYENILYKNAIELYKLNFNK